MKKTIYTVALAALMLTGCSQDENLNVGEEVKMTFTAKFETGVLARAGESNIHVDKMIGAVFTSDGSKLLIKETIDKGTDGTFSWTPALLKSEDYDIVFWAYKSNGTEPDKNGCYDMSQFPTITFNPTNCNEELIEAFTQKLDDFQIKGSSHVVTLKRPLAQVNMAENLSTWEDKVKPLLGGTLPTSVQMTIKGCATTYNALTKEIETGTADYTYSYTPSTDKILVEATDGTKYFALASGYALGKSTVTCDVTLLGGNNEKLYTFSVPSVPTDANYRTNVYGNLLIGNVSYNVSINAGYEDTDINKTPEELYENAKTIN